MAAVLEAAVWGFVAAGSLLLGAIVATLRPPGTKELGLIMGFGSGVLLSAVAFELVEEAVDTSGGLASAAIGLFAGAITFTTGDVLIGRLGYRHRKDIGGAPTDAAGLTIVLGAMLDGIPESAVLGLTVLQTGDVGAAMLVAVLVSNLPEGIAATVGLRNGGWSTAKVSALWVAVALAAAASAGAGYALLDGAPSDVLAFILAFAGGAILTMVSTSMSPEAYEHAGRSVGIVTVMGFATAFAVNWVAG